MTNLERVIVEIESLSCEEFSRLRDWIIERDWEEWDEQIAEDNRQHKLDFLKDEARDEKDSGTLDSL